MEIFSLIFILFILALCIGCFVLGMVAYFLPAIIAYIRKHNHIIPILIMDIFVGWTFLGWLASLLWALNSDVEKEDDI